MFRFGDDIYKLERKMERLKKYKPNMKSMLKQLINRYNKTNLTVLNNVKGTIENCLNKIDNLFLELESEIEEAIGELREGIEKHGETYNELHFIGKEKIAIYPYDNNKARIVNDGREIDKIDDKWVYHSR